MIAMCDFADLMRAPPSKEEKPYMRRIAGHDFLTARPGEYCQREGCQGIRSFVELIALHEILKLGEAGVAHYGNLEQAELDQIRAAKVEIDQQMTAIFGF